MTTFYNENWFFELKTPDYEIPVFGGKIAELRLVSHNPNEYTNVEKFPLNNIEDYLIRNKILACTFRGKEDIILIQHLNDLGFKFIATYNAFMGDCNEFNEIKLRTNLKIIKATENDFEGILAVELKVFDYSTFQIDPLFNNQITSLRNILRVKSYFKNPNHITYIAKSDDKVIGFIQFVTNIEKKAAECVNGAIDPEFQGFFVGPKLYSDAFKNIFDSGISRITGGFCTQNIPVSKIFKAFNFKIVDQEIHLRLHTLIKQ